MNQHGVIVVGFDFSPAAAAALGQAVRVASWNRATVRVEHVVEPLFVADVLDPSAFMASGLERSIIEDASARWKEYVTHRQAYSGLHFHAQMDSVVGGLVSRAEAEKASLLVLGARAREAAGGGGGAGPIASGCVRRARCDVLLVQSAHERPFTTVVACVDFSVTSRRAFEQALRTAIQDRARLVVVHAYSSPWRRSGRSPEGEQRAHEDAFRDALLARLKSFCEADAHAAGFAKPEYALIDRDERGHGIGAYMAGIGADLAVLGKRGGSNLRDVVLGSTAEHILRTAPCSTLVVHPV